MRITINEKSQSVQPDLQNYQAYQGQNTKKMYLMYSKEKKKQQIESIMKEKSKLTRHIFLKTQIELYLFICHTTQLVRSQFPNQGIPSNRTSRNKNMIVEISNSMNMLNSLLDTGKEKISNLESRNYPEVNISQGDGEITIIFTLLSVFFDYIFLALLRKPFSSIQLCPSFFSIKQCTRTNNF